MPNPENLIPKDFSKMPNHKELSAKGGRAKTFSAQIRGIRQTENPNQEEREYWYKWAMRNVHVPTCEEHEE